MRHLRKMRILLGLLPARALKASFVRRHLEACDKCREGLADAEQARSVTIAGTRLSPVKDFWPQFEERVRIEELRKKESGKRPVITPAWRWAMGTAGLAGVAVLTFLILAPPQRSGGPDPAVKLLVNYAELYEQPAQAIIFQTQEAGSTFVWVEKQN